MALVTIATEVSATLVGLVRHGVHRASSALLRLAGELSHDALTATNHLRLGLQASLDVRTCRKMMNDHPETVGLIKELLFINGCFQIGVPILFLFVLQPLLQSLFPDGSGWGKALDYLIFALFPLLWMIPVYFISLGLNFLKRKALAEKVIKPEQRSLSATPLEDLAAETLILLVVSMQAFAFSLVPHIGKLLSIVINCCLNSFVLFDYRLMSIGVNLPARISLVNRVWLYFVGFGLPLTLLSTLPYHIGCTSFTAYVLSTAVYECAFPWLVILASCVSVRNDIPKSQPTWLPATVSIFQWADQITGDVCRWLFVKLGFSSRID